MEVPLLAPLLVAETISVVEVRERRIDQRERDWLGERERTPLSLLSLFFYFLLSLVSLFSFFNIILFSLKKYFD